MKKILIIAYGTFLFLIIAGCTLYYVNYKNNVNEMETELTRDIEYLTIIRKNNEATKMLQDRKALEEDNKDKSDDEDDRNNSKVIKEDSNPVDAAAQSNVFFVTEEDGFVVVYLADRNTCYERTNITTEALPQSEVDILRAGFYVKDETELISLLEHYSS